MAASPNLMDSDPDRIVGVSADMAPGSTEASAEEANRPTARNTGALSDPDYLIRVRRWFKECRDHEKETREEEDEDFAFYAGHQWTDEQRELMTKSKRPALTLNFCLPIINAVTGEERLNRQEIRVYGRQQEDEAGSNTMSELIRWVMDTCRGEYAVSRAFRAQTIGGRGWIEVGFTTDINPEGLLVVLPVPHKEIWLDPLSRMEDASDARFLIREKHVSEDELFALWPDKADEIRLYKATSLTPAGVRKETTPKGDAYALGGDKIHDPKEGTWQVLEVWHHEMKPGAVVQNPQTGLLEEVTEEELTALLADSAAKRAMYDMAAAQALASQPDPVAQAQIRALLPPPPPELQFARRQIRCFYQGFVCGDTVLDRKEAPVRRLKRFPYVPCFGLWDDEKGRWFGLVRPIKDPQRQHNVEQSAILHWTQTTPKSGWMAPKGAFVDRQRWQEQAAQPGFIGEYNPARGKPEQITPPPLPRHIMEMASTRLQQMREISGVNIEMMGVSQRADAGIAMEMRKKSQLTVLQTLFDNLRLTRQTLGTVLIHYIQHFIADNRKVRVVGPSGVQYIQATSDLSFAEYDAIVEDATDTISDRMATMYVLQTVLPMVLKAGVPVPPSFVDILPINQKIKDDWKLMLQGPPPGAGPMPGGPPIPGAPPGAPA